MFLTKKKLNDFQKHQSFRGNESFRQNQSKSYWAFCRFENKNNNFKAISWDQESPAMKLKIDCQNHYNLTCHKTIKATLSYFCNSQGVSFYA